MCVFRVLCFQEDGRSPISSGAESDDSSGPDSPSVVMPLRTTMTAAATQQQKQLTRAGISEQQQQLHANGKSFANAFLAAGGSSLRMSSSNHNSKASGGSSGQTGSGANNLAGLVGSLSRIDGLVSDIPSGLYPPSAFQHIPPEIVMQLVEMGHLKFQSNEGN